YLSALGQKADVRGANGHVRFTPKADMCSALAHVCFGPIGDIHHRAILFPIASASASAAIGSGARNLPPIRLRHHAWPAVSGVSASHRSVSNRLTGRTLGSPGGVATRFGSVGGRLAAACR